jgi:hypothetical protein
MNLLHFTRRQFTTSLLAALSTPHLLAADAPKRRAAILGHTGEGDYGHGLDVIFNDLPGVEVVALADPDEAARRAAAR